jgi:hypothetical protein
MPVKIRVGQTYPSKNEGEIVVLREMKFTNRNQKNFPFLCSYMASGATEEELLYYSANGVCSTKPECDVSDEKFGYVCVYSDGEWSSVYDSLDEMKQSEGEYEDGECKFADGQYGLRLKFVPLEEYYN